MLFYILFQLWFSKYKDKTLKKTQRRLLTILILSVSVLVAVGAIFSGFEHELSSQLKSTTKEVVVYDSPENIQKFYDWLEGQPGVTERHKYGQQVIKVACEGRNSMALVLADPNYKHERVLVSPLALKLLKGCGQTLELTSYDLTQLFPMPRTIEVKYSASHQIQTPIPTIIVSPKTYERLGYSADSITHWLSFRVPSNKNVVMWLYRWPSLQILDTSQWSEDFSKAIFSQKIMMWLVMGLLLVSALFQLKHVLEDMLNQQSKFWSLMCLHGTSRRWISLLFSLYISGFIFVTVLLSIPVGLVIAYAMNPLVQGVERVTGLSILDPQFFITDHIPVAIAWQDILFIECSVCVMAAIFTFLALRSRKNLDIMKVLRNA